MVVDTEFRRFTEHGTSVARSHSWIDDGLGLRYGSTRAEWVSTELSGHLRGRRAWDTKPEVAALRRAVHRLGLRFRLQRKVAVRCTADFVLPRYNVAVFVDGCFWHGCPVHGPKTFRGPNAPLWGAKIRTNKERDRRNTAMAEAAGWAVVRVWECEIRADVGRAVLSVARQCDQTREPVSAPPPVRGSRPTRP
ncbi:very short patch repair endonuclease [Nocardiopsis trehalosi]|uniref:very short patch repair endonuclease n=1 Tax=Nocardiopsis trehalosi TaxID=109329 RepID=UPI000A002C3A|nr:very short patch repair endonuclease [Nocardiopsis trehalosi]